MSADELRLASCAGKAVFDTWTRAKRRARSANRRKGRKEHWEPYICHFCGRYHLGSDWVGRKARRAYRQRRMQG